MTVATETIRGGVADRLAHPILATVLEASQYLNVSRSKVYQMMDAGLLPWVKLGASRRIRWADLERLVSDNLVGGVAE